MSVDVRLLASLLDQVYIIHCTVMSHIDGFSYIALGLAFVPLKAVGWRIPAIYFHLNIYTGPGYLGALLGVVNIILLIFVFRERKLPTTPEGKPMRKVLKCEWCGILCPTDCVHAFHCSASFRESLSSSISSVRQTKWDIAAAFASIVLFFVILFVFAVFET